MPLLNIGYQSNPTSCSSGRLVSPRFEVLLESEILPVKSCFILETVRSFRRLGATWTEEADVKLVSEVACVLVVQGVSQPA